MKVCASCVYYLKTYLVNNLTIPSIFSVQVSTQYHSMSPYNIMICIDVLMRYIGLV